MKASEKFKLTMFLIYTIFWQSMIWGGTFYIVFVLHESAWWVVVSVSLASSQFKPDMFGLNYDDKEDKNEKNEYKKEML
jgi:hypothetical protein